MDLIKWIASLGLTAAIGVGTLPESAPPKEPQAEVLVVDWPAINIPSEPVADPLPNASFDELRQIADRLDKHAKDLKEQAETIKSEGFSSYIPKIDAASCQCNCDCPDEDRLRVILREELKAAMEKYQGVKSSGSVGGSAGSTGGQPVTTSSSGYYSKPVVVSQSKPVVVQSQPPVKVAISTRTYRAASGCTVQETTYSDGSKSSQTISCPLNQPRRLFGR